MKKDYSKAGSGFKNYLAHYPSGTYAGSAYYWLGEVNLNSNNLKQAAENFQTVIKKFPKSDKFDDAKLKLAMVHAQQGNTALARQELKRIKADHPGSTMAQLASIQLQQLESGAN
jgi:tol-pal system protein YbgF